MSNKKLLVLAFIVIAGLAVIQVFGATKVYAQQTPPDWCYDFKRDLSWGDGGKNVKALHIALEKEGFQIKDQKEKEKGFYRDFTASVVTGFQQKYRTEILDPFGLDFGTGRVGKKTRDKLNSLYGCTKPTITVLSPNGGEKWVFGKRQTIIWRSTRIKKLAIYLWFPDGGTCKLADNVRAAQGKYTVTLQENQRCPNIPIDITPGEQYKISIWSIDDPTLEISAPHDASDNYFGIVAPTRSITVISPNGGERWKIGKVYRIRWRSSNLTKESKIEIGIQSPLGYSTIFSNLVNDGAEQWRIEPTTPIRDTYKIVITSPTWTNPIAKDESDRPFSIIGEITPVLQVRLDQETPPSKIIPIGSTNVEVLRFQLSAVGKDITVDGIIVGSTGQECKFSNLKLFKGATQIGQTVPSAYLVSHNTPCQAKFDSLNLVVPNGTSEILSLKLSIPLDAPAGTTFDFGVIEVAANASVYGYVIGNEMTIGGTIGELQDIQVQLASISAALSELMEGIKELLR